MPHPEATRTSIPSIISDGNQPSEKQRPVFLKQLYKKKYDPTIWEKRNLVITVKFLIASIKMRRGDAMESSQLTANENFYLATSVYYLRLYI